MYDLLYYYFYHGFRAMYLASFVLVPLLVAEWLLPAKKLHWPTVGFNLAYGPVFIALAGMAVAPISALLDPFVPANILGGDPEHWQWWKIALAAFAFIFCYDFLYYWLHRAQHQVPLLWRYHRFHHADINLSASSAFRHHWLEDTFRYFIIATPLLVLFGSFNKYVPWLVLVMGAYGLFIHWNSALHLGPLGRVLVGPQYHRIHHSMEPDHIDKNFAIFFPVLDRVFKTQVLPTKGVSPETGAVGVKAPNHLRHLMPLPPVNG